MKNTHTESAPAMCLWLLVPVALIIAVLTYSCECPAEEAIVKPTVPPVIAKPTPIITPTPSPETAQEWHEWFLSQKDVIQKVVQEIGTDSTDSKLTAGQKHSRAFITAITLSSTEGLPVKAVLVRTDYKPAYKGKDIVAFLDQGTTYSVIKVDYSPPEKPTWTKLTKASVTISAEVTK